MNTLRDRLARYGRAAGLLLLAAFSGACASSTQTVDNAPTNSVTNHSEVIVRHLGGDVNTTEDDFGLVQGPSNIYTYLTSARSSGEGRQDLFRAQVPLSGISVGAQNTFVPLRELNTSENEGCAAFTPDGLTMIFAAAGRADAIGSSDLYQADLIQGRWQNVRNLTALNTPAWESQPTLSSDGRTLYFISDRDGGVGGQDIYVATRVGDNWTAPQNLGSSVNSAGNEASPFIAADGKILYFATDGRHGLGGYDIYVTRNVGGVWSSPENAGTPINSPHDDMFYSAELGTQHAFLASDRDSTLGGLDIYSVEPNPFASEGVTVVKGHVRDAETKLPLAAAVTITDLQTSEEVARFRSSDSTGEYLVVLQPGRTYSITAEAPGHVFYSDIYEVQRRTDVTLTHDIELYPTSTGRTRLLVFFDFNSAQLKRESMPDLNRAVDLMKNNPDMLVTVGGYTDSVGSDEFNRKLSDARAHSVKDYLVQHGVSDPRVNAVGYGEASPIADNGTEEGRALNRRVEFQVRRNR